MIIGYPLRSAHMRARAPGLIIVVLACALSACGGDEGSSGARKLSKDEQQVRAVLREALTTKDPDACTRLLTQNLLEQVSTERGKGAVRDCRMDADSASATSVMIDRVAVSGPRAGADVRPRGGSLTFKTVTIGLRKAGGRWKLDRLKKGTLDRPAFIAFARKELRSGPGAVAGKTVDCFVREISTKNDEQITRALFKADQRLFLLPITICAVRNELALRGVPGDVVQCVVGRVRRELTTGATARRLRASRAAAAELADSPALERVVRRSAIACAPARSDDGRYQPAAAYP